MALYDDIKSNFILPDAYVDWKDYRRDLTGYLIKETNCISVPLSFSANMDETSLLPTLAIIGAGACNDIDLSLLQEHFSNITLIDYDTGAMQTALDNYNLNDCPLVNCKTASINGLYDTHYQEFCEKLQQYVQATADSFTPEDFERYATTLVDRCLDSIQDYIIPLPENAYDYICCFGVHSQLQAMFSYIYHVFEVNLRELFFHDTPCFNAHFTKRLQRENERFIPHFHDTLLKCAKQAVFLGLEKKRTNDSGAIEGAYQALKDIQKRNLCTEETTLLWPFLPAQDIQYEMSILKIV